MYSLITVNAGHSALSKGASGNGYQEHEIARIIKDKLIIALKSVGQNCVDTTSDATSSSAVLSEQVFKCNLHNKVNRLDVSIHLNATKGGTGTEVLFLTQSDLANRLSHAISTSLGIRNRGAKQRKDLYFLKNTHAPSVLLEICFIDNKQDMELLMKNMDLMIKSIVKVLTGKEVQPKPKQIIYFQTGGCSGQSLSDIHNLVFSHNWWYDPTRNEDGTISFLIGGFGEYSNETKKIENYLKEKNYWYEIKTQ